jgi:hypothetical protein
MTLTILLIGIGKYIKLIDDLIDSFKVKPYGINVTFILFTDDIGLKLNNDKNYQITRIFQPNQGWPLNTLLRYRMFFENIDIITNNSPDKVVFMNANLRLMNDKFFDEVQKNKFLYVTHPGYSGIRTFLPRPFEVKTGNSSVPLYYKFFKKYIQGSLWGGTTGEFLNALNWLYQAVEYDISNNIYARVDDESYLNAFRLRFKNQSKILDSSYSWPEGWYRRRACNIFSVDKIKIFGIDYMRQLKKGR